MDSETDHLNEDLVETKPMSRRLKLLIISFIAALVFFISIVVKYNPNQGGPTIVLTFLGSVFVLLMSMSAIIIEILSSVITRRHRSPLNLFYTSLLWSIGLVFLLGLQTLHQLQVLDIVLIVLLEIVATFYLLRRF